MIKGITRPAIFYDLVGVAHDSVVSVGRESDSIIRLDCPEVPFLLSRKHARICVHPNGSLMLKDHNSTNGTYVAREGEFLRRLRPEENWELKRGDQIGFGGPETIVARSETPDVTVANPFLFRYTPLVDDSDSDSSILIDSSSEPHAVVTVAGQARARKFSEIDGPCQQEDMECEEASTSSPDKEAKKPKTAVSAKEIAALLSNHLTCAICHDWLAGAHALSCGHMFCGVCLASWLTQKQSCPECRKPTAGLPVRCRGVDNSITDLLGHNLVSPSSKRERRRKQLAWNEVGEGVLESWATAMQERRQQATNTAAQHLSRMTGQPAAQPVPVAPMHVAPAAPPHHQTRRANHGGAAPNRQGR
ncbi:E3 ubiquitin-protein ligase [Tetrabaena socialis]|uniref:E3 ubiquitin-protein ligase CHFR n=1 Tax=Tetrabaena socialis TaxID=47790 RepID=A0A2J8A8T1_9CHLO|nr:E3 ubiquitin-protein ligase [Tetrabaena socialis]|eukprot:PNH08910.1 E3 ubiquitin-protein ligase [Tetrabaena socialis]